MLTIKFSNRNLEKCYRNRNQAIHRWGHVIGENYIKRVNAIFAADSIDDLYKIPQLKFHPLTGDRKGQYAISLTGRARLIVGIENNSIIIIEEVNTEHYE